MRKSFKLEDLDCANCAAKMQDAISKMPGVEKCTVNFMMQKMTLVADDARVGEQPGELCGDICRMLATAQPVLIRGAGKRTGSEG